MIQESQTALTGRWNIVEMEMWDPDAFNMMVQGSVPFKRPQTPEDMGELAVFLASDAAKEITGQAINVDGGSQMN